MESEGFAIYDTLMQMKCEASFTFFELVLISLSSAILVVVRMIGWPRWLHDVIQCNIVMVRFIGNCLLVINVR